MNQTAETEKAILKTIACYQALGSYPLNAIEIYRYLQKQHPAQPAPALLEILKLLDQSPFLKKHLACRNGLYFFQENRDFYYQRIYRSKISILKWRKIKRIGFFLGLVPYVRGVAINGSLALNNAKPDSDIDFLVFAQKDRIWTCRLMLSLFMQLIGQRRHGPIIADKICLNHYIAEGSYLITLQNPANAQLYSRLVPLYSYKNFYLFQKENLAWIKDLIFFPIAERQNHLRRINEEGVIFKIGRYLGHAFESILELAGAPIIETMIGQWQKKRILAKIKNRPIDEIELRLSDSYLIFHYPIGKNKEVMETYTRKLKLLFPDEAAKSIELSQ